VDILPLVPDGVKAYPSSTAVVSGDHAYIFASYEKAPNPMLLTRIPLKGLAAPKENLQYLANDGSWKPGLDPSNAKFVMTPGASEMSVRYHKCELPVFTAEHGQGVWEGEAISGSVQAVLETLDDVQIVPEAKLTMERAMSNIIE
jgi:hypothetical protein